MKPNVLLIHGVLMHPLEMLYLGNQLKKLGFQVHYIFYQSVLKTSEKNAEIIYKKIKKLNLANMHIVAHSLGGIIAMHLLNKFEDLPQGKVVMLGSPINGSLIAKKLKEWPIISTLLARSMPKALSGEGIPEWRCKRDWGMIAGTSNRGLGLIVGGFSTVNDGTVLLEETKHPKQTEHICVSTSHTGMLFSKEVAQLSAQFLHSGSFYSDI